MNPSPLFWTATPPRRRHGLDAGPIQPPAGHPAVTSSCGNRTIEKTTYNALRVMTLLASTPMGKVGRPVPLAAKAMNAPTVHGELGLTAPPLPEPAVSLRA